MLHAGAPDLGDWRAEYRALSGTCALTRRSDRGAVLVAGDRRAEMLNGLLSNDVMDLATVGRHALLLTAKGHVLTDLRVLPRESDVLLDVPQAGLQNLLAALERYLPPMYATHEDASGAIGQLGLYGPRSLAALKASGLDAPQVHLGVRELDLDGAGVLVVRNRRLAGDGVELFTGHDRLPSLAARLLPAVQEQGGRPAGARAFEIARIEAGVPRYGVDISEANLAQETGLEREAISYDKGCYLGQEVVARVHFRGHVNRYLRGLRFSGRLPAAGATLSAGSKEVGAVTSSVISPELGPIGLGYVRREAEPGAVIDWSDGDGVGQVTVVDLPLRGHSV